MNYRIRIKPYYDRAKNYPLKNTSEEEANRQYDAAIISLLLAHGGYIQLYEQNNREPIRAQRVGNG